MKPDANNSADDVIQDRTCDRLVSVIIPTYNRERELARCITSVLDQRVQNVEIIVVDDCSSDDIDQVIKRFQKLCNLRCVRLTTRSGAQRARIAGIKEAKGAYLVFLDSDDELTPNSIQVRLEALGEAKVEAALVYGDMFYGEISESCRCAFTRLKGNGYPYLLRELSLCPYSTMMIANKCFEKAGFPSPDFPAWQDDDMVLTIGRFFPLLHCGQVVAIYHPSPDSLSVNYSKLADGARLMVMKYKRELINHHGRLRYLLWQLRVQRARIRAFEQKLAGKTLQMRVLRRILSLGRRYLERFLSLFFEHMYA